VVGRVEGCDVLPDGDPWGLLQSPKCKKRLPNSYPQVVVDYYGPFPGRHIGLLRYHAFSVASFDIDVSPKFQTFQIIHNV
jgi:hypothetical protein